MSELIIKENTSLDPTRTVDPSYIDPKNYAEDPAVCQRVTEKILTLLTKARYQRTAFDEFCQRMYKVWAAQNDTNTRLYQGMSDVYLPSANIALKTLIDHTKAQVFPIDAPIAVRPSPMDPMAQQNAMVVQLLQQRNFEQAEVVQNFNNWAWQAYAMGCSPSKVVWKTVQIIGYKPTIAALDPMGKPMIQMVPSPVTLYEGPTFTPVDLLKWGKYPYNAQRISDAQLVWEDTYRSIDELNAAGDDTAGEPQWFNVPKAILDNPQTTADQGLTQGLLDTRTDLFGFYDNQIPDKDLFRTTEIYTYFDLSGDGKRLPVKITVCGSTILECRQIPLIDQQPPYVELIFDTVLQHGYGRSKVQNIESFVLTQNAALNQGIDSNMFAGNPMTGINALTLQGRAEDLEVTPMGIYLFNGKPTEGLTFFDIPNTLGANLQLVQTLQDVIDRSTQAPPTLAGELPADGTTATAANLAAQGAMTGVSADTLVIKGALKKWLFKSWKLTQQYLSTQAAIGLTQAPLLNVDPSVTVGEYGFDFVTGPEAQSMIQQQNQMLAQAQMQGGMQGAAQSAQTPGGSGENNQPGGADHNETQNKLKAGMDPNQ